MKDLVQTVAALIGLVVTVFVATRGFGRLLFTGSTQPASAILLSRDPLEALADHFSHLVSRIGRPLAIFIDDIDRCQPAYIVELLEGIMTLFTRANVTYVVAGDRTWVRAAFEQVYEEYVSRMDQPGRPLGYLFLDKVFQLTAPVPYLSAETQQAYWERLIAVERKDGAPDARPVEERAQELAREVQTGSDARAMLQGMADPGLRRAFVGQAIQELARPESTQRTEHLLRPFAHLLESNPRAMKRLVNAFGVREAIDLIAGGYADPRQLALWTILELRWPALADHLAEQPDLVSAFAGRAEVVAEAQPESVRSLIGSEAVRRVLIGDRIGVELDADAIRACVGLPAGLQPGRSPTGHRGLNTDLDLP